MCTHVLLEFEVPKKNSGDISIKCTLVSQNQQHDFIHPFLTNAILSTISNKAVITKLNSVVTWGQDIGHSVRIELINNDPLIYLANHYNTWGTNFRQNNLSKNVWENSNSWNYFTPWKFFTPASTDGLPRESGWQQASSLQDSSEYSGLWQQCWSRLSSDFLFFHSPFQAFGNRSKHTNYSWCHHHPHVPHLS